MFFTAMSCPHCKCPVEVRLLGVSSGLGPAEIKCLKCQEPLAVGRSEWSDKSLYSKLCYIAISLFYVVMFGVLTGAMVDQGVQSAQIGNTNVRVRFDSQVFAIAACAGGLAVIPFQIYRVIASLRRSRLGYTMTPADYFLGLQWNLHAKGLVLLILVWALSMIKYGR